MDTSLPMLLVWMNSYLWPFARIGAMLTAAPIFGARIFPMRIRLVLAVALTMAVRPVVGPMPPLDTFDSSTVVVLFHQLLIGATMGMVLQITFAFFIVAGQIVAMSMGLGFASVVDPQNGIQVPIVSQFYWSMAALLFFALDGHLAFIEVLAQSFRALPVGPLSFSYALVHSILSWSSLMFAEALRIALPVLSVTLLANIALAVTTRATPQLNLFAVGFPAALVLGFGTMWATLGHFGPVFERLMGSSFQLISTILMSHP